MIKFFFLFGFLTVATCIQAQDLIVTTAGDSLNCKITNVTRDAVYYTIFNPGLNHTQRLALPMINIATYARDVLPVPVQLKGINHKAPGRAYPIFDVEGTYGKGYLLAALEHGLDPGIKKFLRELKLGRVWSGGIHYYINSEFGVGLQYNSFFSENSVDAMATYSNGQTVYGSLYKSVSINYAGAEFLYHFEPVNRGHEFTTGAGLGWTSYSTVTTFPQIDETDVGHTIGVTLFTDYGIEIAAGLQLMMRFDFQMGVISRLKRTTNQSTSNATLDPEQFISTGRIDLGIGLRILK